MLIRLVIALGTICALGCGTNMSNEEVAPVVGKKFHISKEEDPTRKPGAGEDPEGAKIRDANIATLKAAGFKPADWLPTHMQRAGVPGRLRPVREIAGRAMAIKAVFMWASAPEQVISTEEVRRYVDASDLTEFMTAEEREMLAMDRADAQTAHMHMVGWKLENLWALAWVLGYEKPPRFDGEMIDGPAIRELVRDFLPPSKESLDQFVERLKPRPVADVVAMEDLFYCAHNAVTSAQLGHATVPDGFHPKANGGVVHERRHGLTWVLSPGIAWDDTDLST